MKKLRNWFLIVVLLAVIGSLFIPFNRQPELYELKGTDLVIDVMREDYLFFTRRVPA